MVRSHVSTSYPERCGYTANDKLLGNGVVRCASKEAEGKLSAEPGFLYQKLGLCMEFQSFIGANFNYSNMLELVFGQTVNIIYLAHLIGKTANICFTKRLKQTMLILRSLPASDSPHYPISLVRQ